MKNLNKKGWIDLNCDVCKTPFKKPFQILYPSGHSDFAVTESQFCSKNCEEISKRTFNNPVPNCFYCRKHVDLSGYEELNGWFADYKNEKCYPLCEDCDKKFVEHIRKEYKI